MQKFAAIGLLGVIAPLSIHPVSAQLLPDSTLGGESSIVAPNSTLNGAPAIQIGGGATRGDNLFHSFEQFNVDEGQRVYFANPSDISTILNRVTGENASNILGTLGVAGGADLFFINPNGLIFGPNATLDVNGSAIFSTADSVLFDDEFTFSALSPAAPPLLTVSAPVGLQYGTIPGDINVQGDGHGLQIDSIGRAVDWVVRENRPAGLQVPSGHTLALVGGDLMLAGGNVTVESGRLELGSVGADSQVRLSAVPLGWALDYGDIEDFQDIRFTQTASADVSGSSDLQLIGRQIVLSEGSAVVAEILDDELAGDFKIQASELVQLTGSTPNRDFLSGLYAQGGPLSTAGGGDLTLITQQLEVQDGAQVTASNFGSGQGRNLTVTASDFLRLQTDADISADTEGPGNSGNVDIQTALLQLEDSAITSNTFSSRPDAGAGGTVNIQANQIQLQESAFISAFSFGNGAAGTINIIEANQVDLLSNSDISATARIGGAGGNVNIQTQQLQLQAGSGISTLTRGSGDAGNIEITNAEQVILDASSISANTRGTGAGGNVEIQAQQLVLQNVATISALSRGEGDTGNVKILAERIQLQDSATIDTDTFGSSDGGMIDIQTEQLQLRRSQIESNSFGSGGGGEINIQAQQLMLEAGGFIRTSTFSSGGGGEINIQAQQLQLQGGGSSITSNTTDIGNGGNLDIQAQQLQLSDGAFIAADTDRTLTSSTMRSGSAGNLNVTADLVLLNNGQISAQSISGDGGNIILRADDLLLLRNGSLVSTQAGIDMAGGDGGNIQIAAGVALALPEENSDIIANAFDGRGGNISLTAQSVLGIEFRDALTPLSDITASSNFGQDGLVTINTLETDPNTETVELPTDFEDASARIGQSLCAGNGSAFTASGRGGLPVSPYDSLNGQVTWEDWYISESSGAAAEQESGRAIASQDASSEMSSKSSVALVEAQSWRLNPQGDVVLTAVERDSGVRLSDGGSCR